MELLNAMNWRYAAKRMTGQPIPAAHLEYILEAIRLSASSAGLQPYRVVVIRDPSLRENIHSTACPQPQIIECSHLLVFASWTNVEPAYIEAYMKRIAETRNVPISSLTAFQESIQANLLSKSVDDQQEWAARQSYIGLGSALIAAASQEIDACPMEGFNSLVLDELLGLSAKGLHSLALLALGYRDIERDLLAKATKVRRSREDLFIDLT